MCSWYAERLRSVQPLGWLSFAVWCAVNMHTRACKLALLSLFPHRTWHPFPLRAATSSSYRTVCAGLLLFLLGRAVPHLSLMHTQRSAVLARLKNKEGEGSVAAKSCVSMSIIICVCIIILMRTGLEGGQGSQQSIEAYVEDHLLKGVLCLARVALILRRLCAHAPALLFPSSYV